MGTQFTQKHLKLLIACLSVALVLLGWFLMQKSAPSVRLFDTSKLAPDLIKRLKLMKPDATVQIAIWIVGEPRLTQTDLYATLAAEYPEVEAALERTGNPFDINDYQRINELEAEYLALLQAETSLLTQPLVSFLAGKGYRVTTFPSMPAIAVTLPKREILALIARPDVGWIELSEAKQQP